MYTQTSKFLEQLRAASTPGKLDLVLPFPPTANKRWQWTRNGVHRSPRLSEYETAVAQACLLQCVGIARPLQPPYALSLELFPPEGVMRPDLDNTLKALFDALVMSGVLVDDRYIEACSVVYAPALPEGEVQVHLWTLNLEPPHE